MARIPRVVLPGYPHHVTQRGNRRQKVFFNRGDYQAYLDYIADGCEAAQTQCWAYCLMPNHVHLVLVPRCPDGLRESLAEAHRHYTRLINFRHGWRGHLWQERFHSFPMDEKHLYAAVRYVEMNPVRARLVTHAGDWPWSSSRAHLQGLDDRLVHVSPMLDRVADWMAYLEQADSRTGLDTLRKHSRTGRPLGNAAFIETAEKLSGRMLKPARPGRKRRTDNRY
jgi:putative transposase